jgi:PAS domain-containing protein
MTGFSREELLSMSIYDIDFKYINMDRSEAKKNFLNAQTNIFSDHKHQYFLVNQRRKNGQVIDVSASVKWIDSWGGITFHFNRDVTEENKLRNKLAESEELYRGLIELGGDVGDAVVMLGNTEPDKGKQVFVSNKWADITGYSKEELADKSFMILFARLMKMYQPIKKLLTRRFYLIVHLN